MQKKASKIQPKVKSDPDQKMLTKYEKHRSMSQKHNAHADLIEAKLRTQGKRIAHEYDDVKYPHDAKPIRKIVKDS